MPFTTIGVNDIGRLFNPTYLVVVDDRAAMGDERWRYVAESGAQFVFSPVWPGVAAARWVRIGLEPYAGTQVVRGGVLPYTTNSTYVATCLAIYMGASAIGLLGVDFCEDHFFGKTGRHVLASRLDEIDEQFAALGATLAQQGRELVNLSPVSKLSGLRRVAIRTWRNDG